MRVIVRQLSQRGICWHKPVKYCDVANMVKRLTVNELNVGSSPTVAALAPGRSDMVIAN